ncbi:transporter substrate-binding domain-containing protein [Donghicola mangrovi]|uniref:Transporter substrate-binding domain-containing protein n=1 Tax=Donghicola mangrovi TaxID=2729614 RepID=A0A850QC11_9RHOB|nr:transporter substrate-binding domain-containing protein [Donghicola mangrovi]NVO23441.1 transporter substrate-binding domain-containing protein [Donghicola mangrovi]
MLGKLLPACLAMFVLLTNAASACGGLYRVKSGDTLTVVAERLYGDFGYWTVLHDANLDRIGIDPGRLKLGQTLLAPCVDGKPVGLEPATAALPRAPLSGGSGLSINVLSGDDYAPFADRDGLNGGMVTDVVLRALSVSPQVTNYQMIWVNDWAAHLDPLLSNALLDMGFPWEKPDCDADPDAGRCATFLFSDPLFEMLVLLFSRNDRPVPFRHDGDLEGRSICRPAGFATHDLDEGGRNWIRDHKISLIRPRSVQDCFQLLSEGMVDAVAVNEFTGRAALREMGLADRIRVEEARPVSLVTLHAVVARSHPQGEQMIAALNEGLARIRQDGTYQRIVGQHLALFWEGQ